MKTTITELLAKVGMNAAKKAAGTASHLAIIRQKNLRCRNRRSDVILVYKPYCD